MKNVKLTFSYLSVTFCLLAQLTIYFRQRVYISHEPHILTPLIHIFSESV
jgi:hypothetical protein